MYLKTLLSLLQNSLLFLSCLLSLVSSIGYSFIAVLYIPKFLLFQTRIWVWLSTPWCSRGGQLRLFWEHIELVHRYRRRTFPFFPTPCPLVASVIDFPSSSLYVPMPLLPSGVCSREVSNRGGSHALSSESLVLWMPEATHKHINNFWCSFEIAR